MGSQYRYEGAGQQNPARWKGPLLNTALDKGGGSVNADNG